MGQDKKKYFFDAYLCCVLRLVFFYKKYDELNIIFFYKDYMRLKKSAVKTDFFKR